MTPTRQIMTERAANNKKRVRDPSFAVVPIWKHRTESNFSKFVQSIQLDILLICASSAFPTKLPALYLTNFPLP
jgi:hypothetical protein